MTGTKMTTLNKLTPGMTAVVTKVNGKDRLLRRHILEMGVTPGTEITLVKTAPLGDPLELKIRGYELTLRKKDAANIEITDIHKAESCPVDVRSLRKPLLPRKGENSGLRLKRGVAVPENRILRFALAGNQNCGKTTLFNQLTGANQRVGNFPGVTVERTDGVIRGYPDTLVTDLPGIYSLSPYSGEEMITRDFLLKEKPDAIINIVDASNIERNLFLTLQLLDLNVPMVIALNMMDEVRVNGGSIDINRMEHMLGVPVIPISAAKKEGIDELVEHAVNVARYREVPEKVDFCTYDGKDEGAVHRCVHAIVHLIEDHADAAGIPVRFAAAKLTEGDEPILTSLRLSGNEVEALEHIVLQMEEESALDREAAMADMRFSFIEKLCGECVAKPVLSRERLRSERLDRILTGKFTALPVFVLIMALIFYLSFGPFGSRLSEWTEDLISWLSGRVEQALTAYGMNPVVNSLIVDGVFAGVGSVLSFLPVIVVLFFFLSMLEDSGYMARVAFVMDKLLRRAGLSGRSFVPMLIGFGCSVPAIMAARTLPSERDRKLTILLTPFMSCSAKLPIYVLLTAAFFDRYQTPVIIGLYVLGIAVGLALAFLLKLTAFRGEAVPFVMELPNYRLPGLKNVWRLIYYKAKYFITKAFTIIFVATVIIWFLQTFDSRLNVAADSADSILCSIGSLLVPLFEPLGISDWRLSTAFLTGFAAKESVVSTISVLLGGRIELLPTLLTPLSAFAFLVFSLLYTPCVAAIATVKKELGGAYAVFIVALQCIVAWLTAFAVYRFGLLF